MILGPAVYGGASPSPKGNRRRRHTSTLLRLGRIAPPLPSTGERPNQEVRWTDQAQEVLMLRWLTFKIPKNGASVAPGDDRVLGKQLAASD
jgi:hypothetical protein